MFEIPNWPTKPIWSKESLDTLLKGVEDEERNVTLEELLENSENLSVPFPIESIRCKVLKDTVPKDKLEYNINSAYPVIHENVLPLLLKFLDHKVRYGKAPEKKIYKGMNVLDLVERLISKRAVTFLCMRELYLLLDGTRGFGEWDKVGTDSETENLNLNKCLSYDEMKLSAFLSVSSFTSFINNGNRRNEGVPDYTQVEPEGVILGLIGTCLVKRQFLEHGEIMITKPQNTKENGYGKTSNPTIHTLLSDFYEEKSFVYKQAVKLRKTEPHRFKEVLKDLLFDNTLYCKRIALSIETLLFEAQQRAHERNTTAFVHVVGIGLGVWKISLHQDALFIDTFVKRLEELGQHLHAISDVVFAHFKEQQTIGSYINGSIIPIQGHPKTGIKVHLSYRDPHNKLSDDHEGKLLVVSYAWDGNALPGNEFWMGSLSTSSDPAAASSTQVAELHNPHVNPKVSAKCLRIAGPYGVIPLSKYRNVAVINN